METIKELNINELEQVNGGDVFAWCFLIGGSSDPAAAACFAGGENTVERNGAFGATACAFLGVGIGINYKD